MFNVIVGMVGMLLVSCDDQGGKWLCLIGGGCRGVFGGRILFRYVLLWWVCFITRSNIGLCMSARLYSFVVFICLDCICKA